MKNLNFKVEYLQGTVNIETGNNQQTTDFTYANILNPISHSTGHGIQVNDKKFEEPALKMCDKISEAIYDFIKETDENS
jgi:hypothetical protein